MNAHSRVFSRVRVALLGLLLATLAGCSFWHDDDKRRCISVEEYQDAHTAPEIAIPEGLDHPDGSMQLHVPPGPEPSEPLSQNADCLTEPPEYFDKPLTAQ